MVWEANTHIPRLVKCNTTGFAGSLDGRWSQACVMPILIRALCCWHVAEEGGQAQMPRVECAPYTPL